MANCIGWIPNAGPTYRISEAARLAGFAPSALRFYENAGLVPAAVRTPAGYRTYDEAAVERLRFVHRTRQLGLALEEIRDLVEIWDAGVCAPAQKGLAERIAARRGAVSARIVELEALRVQLTAAEHAVANAAGDGTCGPGCACLATPEDLPPTSCAVPTGGTQPIELIRRPVADRDPDAGLLAGPR